MIISCRCLPLAAGLLFGLLASVLHARGQVEVSQRQVEEEGFYVDVISFADQTAPRSRLDVYIQMAYELLSFVKKDDTYSASYEVTVSVYDSANVLVTEKLWNEEVKGVSFGESVSSSTYSLSRRVVSVDPGRYTVSVTARDNESKQNRRIVRTLVVSDYWNPTFAMSDVLLITRLSETSGRKAIVPNISSNVGSITEPFPLYFEVYNRQQADSVRYIADVLGNKGELVMSFDTTGSLRQGRNEVFLWVEHRTLPLGDYRIYIRAFPADTTTALEKGMLAATNRTFLVRFKGLPRSIKDLDLAVEQVRYIAKDDEYAKLKDAQTAEEKQNRLLEFWKRRDPNPNTPRNEQMEEYYRRVDYANRAFTHYVEGWRTDMGMVYIMFGPPNDVARHPFEVDSKPYEIWRYYDINYEFVFVDQTGFGDYRLLTPIWEAWQRVKK